MIARWLDSPATALGKKDGGHAAAADLRDDRTGIRKRSVRWRKQFVHRSLRGRPAFRQAESERASVTVRADTAVQNRPTEVALRRREMQGPPLRSVRQVTCKSAELSGRSVALFATLESLALAAASQLHRDYRRFNAPESRRPSRLNPLHFTRSSLPPAPPTAQTDPETHRAAFARRHL